MYAANLGAECSNLPQEEEERTVLLLGFPKEEGTRARVEVWSAISAISGL